MDDRLELVRQGQVHELRQVALVEEAVDLAVFVDRLQDVVLTVEFLEPLIQEVVAHAQLLLRIQLLCRRRQLVRVRLVLLVLLVAVSVGIIFVARRHFQWRAGIDGATDVIRRG